MSSIPPSYKRHRFPPPILSHAVWLYLRFGLSLRAVDEHRHLWPVRTICAVLGVSVSGYYAWRNRPESRRSIENRALLSDIRCAHGGQAVDAMARRAFTPFCAPQVGASDVAY